MPKPTATAGNKPQTRMKRRALFLLIPLILLILLMAALYIAVYDMERRPEAPRPADCIIILGNKVNENGPSLSLQSRLQRGLELYNDGYAGAIIVCGGQGANEPATEASVMKEWLVSHGVPAQAVFTDEISRNTKENLREAKLIMQEQGFYDAIICTSDFHSMRSMRIAADAGIPASPAKADYTWGGKAVARMREGLSWVKYLLGL